MDNTISGKNGRLYYLDNLKVFLTMLVIVHHVGQAYGPTGGFWQYKSSLGENIPWLGSFFGVNAAFFMGLFFMISGYFLPGSLDRKGKGAFVRDKLVRYGIPVLFSFFILQPLEMYFYYMNYSGNKAIGFMQYFTNIYLGIGNEPSWFIESTGWPERGFGHLWFVENLLVFSLVYMLIRTLFKVMLPQLEMKKIFNRGMKVTIFLFIPLFIAIISAVVRIWYPIDKWTGLLGFIQSEVAHLPQYVILFAAGIICYRKEWFSRISARIGYISLTAGLLLAFMVYLHNYIPDWIRQLMYSRWASYESFMAVFLCFGLIVLFREKLNKTTGVSGFLSQNSYAAYILHFPIVLTIQYSLDRVYIFGALGKFITVSILSVAVTYLLSFAVRQLPFVKRVI